MMGYLACPVDLYHTARYQTGRALARARWPGVAWIEPARMGWDLETWWSEWAHILPALNLLARRRNHRARRLAGNHRLPAARCSGVRLRRAALA